MRFRSKRTPRGELLANAQVRMMLTLAGLGAVILVLVTTRPQTVSWIFGTSEEAPRRPPVVSDRLMGGQTLLPDEFNVVPGEASPIVDNDAAHLDRAGVLAMERAADESEDTVSRVPDLLTKTIRDDVIGVLNAETAAWFGTLKFANRLNDLKNIRIPEGQFALFMDSPESCRGRAYSLRGRLRRLTKAGLADSAESFGIRSVYDAWISTRDSGNQLVHVVAVSADPGLPLAEQIGRDGIDVELTGYFFKREGYAAKGADGRGDLALAPLILASRIRTVPKVVMESRAEQLNPWLMWIGLGLLTGVLLVVWQFQISDNVFRGTRTHQIAMPPVRPSFDGVDAVTVSQALHEMESVARGVSTPSLMS